MPTLHVEHLSKGFDGTPVLDDVSFKAREGDIMSVIGPSGCGKTTLFRCILGELEPDHGAILLDGRDVRDVPVERRGVGIVYQNYALFPHMTVGRNVAYGLRAAGRPAREIKERVTEMLDLVGLTRAADRYPRALSGGEMQRVALARALAVEPGVLLLDEAFAALDATTRSEVVHEVRSIIRRAGVTTLLITHDQEEAFLFSRHVVVLNDGLVVTSGTPEAVMAHEHPFIRDFVKMILLTRSRVDVDAEGRPFVVLDCGQRIPVTVPGVATGDHVHVMIKKGPRRQRIDIWEVWPDDPQP